MAQEYEKIRTQKSKLRRIKTLPHKASLRLNTNDLDSSSLTVPSTRQSKLNQICQNFPHQGVLW